MKNISKLSALLLVLSISLSMGAACKNASLSDASSPSLPDNSSDNASADSSDSDFNSDSNNTSDGDSNDISSGDPNNSSSDNPDSDTDSSSDSSSEDEPTSSSPDSSAVPPQSPDPEPPESSDPPETQEPEQPVLPQVPEVPKDENIDLYIICTGSNVNIRSGAGTGYAILGQAEKNTMYAVTEKIGNWYKTYYKNKTAYINASYAHEFTLKKTESEALERVIHEGYKLLGVPYLYGAVRLHDGNGNMLGGFTNTLFDCSSLVQYVYYKGAGVLLGMNTRIQVRQGRYVNPSDLRRGDCIYFTNASRFYNTGIERVGHVAIYLGEGYILHTSSDYARIEQMTTQRWNYYIEARRFL